MASTTTQDTGLSSILPTREIELSREGLTALEKIATSGSDSPEANAAFEHEWVTEEPNGRELVRVPTFVLESMEANGAPVNDPEAFEAWVISEAASYGDDVADIEGEEALELGSTASLEELLEELAEVDELDEDEDESESEGMFGC